MSVIIHQLKSVILDVYNARVSLRFSMLRDNQQGLLNKCTMSEILEGFCKICMSNENLQILYRNGIFFYAVRLEPKYIFDTKMMRSMWPYVLHTNKRFFP